MSQTTSTKIAVFGDLHVDIIQAGEWGTKDSKPYPNDPLFAILEGDKTVFTFGTRKAGAIVQGILQSKSNSSALVQYVQDNSGKKAAKKAEVEVLSPDVDAIVKLAVKKALAEITG